MKRILSLMTLFFILTGAGFHQSLNGQILMTENFDYPAGDLLTSHNWIQQQTTSTFPIAVNNGGLTYPGYVGSGIGNAAVYGAEGQDVFRGFVKQTQPGTLYMTFLVKVTAATTTGDFFISFKESATSTTNVNYRGRVWVKSDASNNLAFGVTKGAMTAPMVPNYTGFTYALNTTYLMVMKFTIVEGTPNDSAKLFINPVIGAPEPTPNVICPDVTSGSDVGLGSVLLRQGTAGSSPAVIVDGIRISKNWQATVTPSNISTLSDLAVDGISIPGFSPNVFTYYDTVPFGQTSVNITSAATCIQAATATNTATAFPGVSTVVVTAENGTSTSTYSITHAYFYYNIALTANPTNGGTVAGGGLLPWGAPATVVATPAAGYGFISWTENGTVVSTSASYTFNPAYSTELVANFGMMYQVMATASPIAGGNITGAGQYVAGSTATLTATPASGYIFDKWTENGNTLGTNPILQLSNIAGNHDVTGVFIVSSNTYTVSAIAVPAEAGVITGAGNVQSGGSITLTATPNWGYVFVNWTENGNVLGSDLTLTLTNVQANHSIEANFRPIGVGVDETQAESMKIYPALVESQLTVETGSPASLIQIFDMTGRVVLEQVAGSARTVIFASSLRQGMYMVVATTADGKITGRIIKK